VNNNSQTFIDRLQGERSLSIEQANEDFILKRKDGLHAYMLAVVVDDIYQGVTHIIRGDDLADTTCQQAYLFQRLGSSVPTFGHLPLATHPDGHKLSKQTHARALDDRKATANLWAVLTFLNQAIPDNPDDLTRTELLDWAVTHWQPERFKGMKSKQAV
jgi:glutamyl-Q tRNA(Asp) synthetase